MAGRPRPPRRRLRTSRVQGGRAPGPPRGSARFLSCCRLLRPRASRPARRVLAWARVASRARTPTSRALPCPSPRLAGAYQHARLLGVATSKAYSRASGYVHPPRGNLVRTRRKDNQIFSKKDSRAEEHVAESRRGNKARSKRRAGQARPRQRPRGDTSTNHPLGGIPAQGSAPPRQARCSVTPHCRRPRPGEGRPPQAGRGAPPCIRGRARRSAPYGAELCRGGRFPSP